MIRWSTPTQPVVVKNADLASTGCHVVVTFAQGCRRVDVCDPPMAYDAEGNRTVLYVGLNQLQTAGFEQGNVEVQVNALDWAGYRIPTDKRRVYMGSNLLDVELPWDGGGAPVGEGQAGFIPIGTDVALVTYDLNGGAGLTPGAEAFAKGQVSIDGSYYSTRPRLIRPYSQDGSSVTWGDAEGPSATAPDGKAFGGWSTDPEASAGYLDMPEAIYEDTTVYAIWVDE